MTNEERARKFIGDNATALALAQENVVGPLTALLNAVERESFDAGFKRGTEEGPHIDPGLLAD